MLEIAFTLFTSIVMTVLMRIAYRWSTPLREDISASCRLALREFRNRRFLRRLRSHINEPFN